MNPFPGNAWLTYAEVIARWGVQTRKDQIEYVRRDPAVLAALPEVQSMLAEKDAEREKLVEALRECRDDWCAKADADLEEQEGDEIMMDYPTPRKMTVAMRKADKLTTLLAELGETK